MNTLAEISQAFLQEEYEESPVMATSLGVEGFDDRLDDLSEAAFERRADRAAAWLARFERLDPAGLSTDERIDLDLARSVLRGRLVLVDWEAWRRQPDIYTSPGLTGVFGLLLHRLKPEPQLAGAVAARLRAIPGNLASGRQNLRAELTPRLFVERSLGQVRAGARYLREQVAPEVADERLRAEVGEAAIPAADAMDAYAGFLEDLRERARGQWAIGEERYTRLLREKELLPYDARSLCERGRAAYEQLAEDLRRCARAVAGSDDWVRVLESLGDAHPPTPEAMLAAYAEWTQRARRFLDERRLVTFPAGEECVVEPSPPFQRPVLAVASYQMPPPLSASMKGHFFVPFPPEGASEEEVQKRLGNNHYAGIPSTSVHEAYPGHHWHLVTARANPSALRGTFRTAYFSEGWALYAEQMMREQGFFQEPGQEMSQYEAMIFRAARVVVDTSLHRGEMDFDEAVRFMIARAVLPEPTARAEVARYCSWPTQASAYLTGCLQILELRERYLRTARQPASQALRAFHDRLASSGSLPVALAERALFSDVASTREGTAG